MPVITTVNDMKGTPQELIVYLLGQDREKEFEVLPYHEKRSLNANAYYWALVGKISETQNIPKEEIHRQLLTDYGTWEYEDDGSPKWVILPKNKPLPLDGYYFDTKADVTVKGTKSGEEIGRAYIVIRGSHTYKSDEMKRLLDGTIQEAQNLDIETRTPQEIELMIQQMKDKENGTGF